MGSIGDRTRVKSRKYKVTDHTGPIEGPLSPTLTAPLPPLNLSVPEARELGFLPLRDDFEREYDNECETLLSGEIIHHTDEEVDMAYRLSLVSMYRLRLRERQRRKRVARDFNLVNVYAASFKKGQSGAKKKGAKEHKEFLEKMKKFSSFMTLHEQERFYSSLQKEKQLKSRIKELMKYRRNGIRSQEDAEEFEKELAKREKSKDIAKRDKRLLASLHIASSNSGSGGAEEAMDTATATTTTHLPRRSHHTSNSSTPTSHNEQGNKTPTTKSGSTHASEQKSSPDKRSRNNIPKLDLFKDILTEKPLHNLRSPTLTNGHHREMLSETEKRLCKRIGMKTNSYMTIKTCILKDYLKRQHGTPVKLRFPPGHDKTHRRTILTFLEHSGWIQMEH